MTTLDFEVVLPVFNEHGVLEDSVSKIQDYCASAKRLRDQGDRWITIADNGSTDGTTQLAERLAAENANVEFVHIAQRGRGAALRHVWSNSRADFSLYMDVDLSTDLEAIACVWKTLLEGADVVVGSRLHRDAKTTRSLRRECLSRGYNLLVKWFLRTRSFDDAQCGFKAVRVGTVRPLLPMVGNNDWFFDTELLAIAEKTGLDVRSVPVTWVEDRDSKVNILATVFQDVKGLARLRSNLSKTGASVARARTSGRSEP